MKRFAQLYRELDQTTRTSAKVSALESYFREAPPADAIWALHVLLGRRRRRPVSGTLLRTWVAEWTGLPLWLVETSYHQVGDLAETLSLLAPDPAEPAWPRLAPLMEEVILPLGDLDEDGRRKAVMGTLATLTREGRFIFLKLMTGALRVGAGPKLVTRALAGVADTDPAAMAHRLSGKWDPTAETWERLLAHDGDDDPARPYPFYLAHPLEDEPDSLGPLRDWQVEWKWDGIRLQLIRRSGTTLLWSRGEELVTHQFPEIATVAEALPDGTVLDGEALGWKNDGPLPFGDLQRRLGRKKVGARLLEDVPVAFQAYDIMEHEGEDVRARPLDERRRILEAAVDRALTHHPELAGNLVISPLVSATDWSDVARLRATSRDRGVEGFMLKAREGAYGVGRVRGGWWKWKIDPLELDVVLIYAQAGHGRRAGLHTDYTFGVWDGDELVPVAKAYSGLTDAEIRRLDRWIRRNTIERFGPVRSVEREHVFQLAFDGIRSSSRHRSGVALRFPRIARWREDKTPADAATLADARALLEQVGG